MPRISLIPNGMTHEEYLGGEPTPFFDVCECCTNHHCLLESQVGERLDDETASAIGLQGELEDADVLHPDYADGVCHCAICGDDLGQDDN